MGFNRAIAWKHLLLLLIMLIAQELVESRNIIEDQASISGNSILQLPSTKIEESISNNNNEDHTHMGHMIGTNMMVYFNMEDLKIGKTIPIYIPKKDLNKAPHFLPRDQADSIPFSSEKLESLLSFFSFSEDSPQGRAMADTLAQCEARPIEGETKTCATSLESMLDFARGAFGPHEAGVLSALTTELLTGLAASYQNYTVSEAPRAVLAPRMVACHTMPYPYAVFYCHYQDSESKVVKVVVRGETSGDLVDALAVCHMDTSKWGRTHVSFRVLGVEPGTSPVCHFFPAEHLVWLPIIPNYSSIV